MELFQGQFWTWNSYLLYQVWYLSTISNFAKW